MAYSTLIPTSSRLGHLCSDYCDSLVPTCHSLLPAAQFFTCGLGLRRVPCLTQMTRWGPETAEEQNPLPIAGDRGILTCISACLRMFSRPHMLSGEFLASCPFRVPFITSFQVYQHKFLCLCDFFSFFHGSPPSLNSCRAAICVML